MTQLDERREDVKVAGQRARLLTGTRFRRFRFGLRPRRRATSRAPMPIRCRCTILKSMDVYPFRVVALNVTFVLPLVFRAIAALSASRLHPRRSPAVFLPFGLVEGLRFQEYLVYVAHEMFVPGVT
jgi:hypothetical protein